MCSQRCHPDQCYVELSGHTHSHPSKCCQSDHKCNLELQPIETGKPIDDLQDKSADQVDGENDENSAHECAKEVCLVPEIRGTEGLLEVRNENGPFAGRIRQYLERLAQTRFELLDEGSRKRGLPSEPTDGLDNAKRMRLGAELPDRPAPPPLPPGPVSHAQLFTLTGDRGLSSFDVTQLPIDLVVRITLPILHHIDQSALDAAIGDVRSRLHSLKKRQAAEHQNQIQTHGEEEEDYEPDFGPTQEQVLNQAENLPPEDPLAEPPDLALGPFKLPQPPPLTPEETEKIGKGTIERVFNMMSTIDEPAAVKRQKPGLNRVAGSNYDKDAWMTLFIRLATRASAGLDEEDISDDDGDESNGTVTKVGTPPSLSNGIREMLWKSIITDFRARLPIAISWLSEEWLNDQLQLQ
ncbi:MAG: hypothetical protein Q9183_005132, partial [Haloplaca sp. 2 TL-2023]